MWWPTKVTFAVKSIVYRGIGLMCGTSQDGLDVADVRFTHDQNGNWTFDLLHGTTIPLPANIKSSLTRAREMTGEELSHLHVQFGKWSGQVVRAFLQEHQSKATFVASHGVTVFHQPHRGFTTQIGSGAAIATESGLPVICDFRQSDVSKGGAGAPLVPSCDRFLFSDYDATLNLGGFANFSVLGDDLRGFDIGPCNLLLNHLIAEKGLAFDDQGQLASTGQIIPSMLDTLSALDYYQGQPASLGAEWFTLEVVAILERFSDHPLTDRLRTSTEHIAQQIARHTRSGQRILFTGGGAFNSHLIERTRALSEAVFEIPDESLIDMKEAICFTFLGIRRLLEVSNIYSSSTGAWGDSSGGAVYLP